MWQWYPITISIYNIILSHITKTILWTYFFHLFSKPPQTVCKFIANFWFFLFKNISKTNIFYLLLGLIFLVSSKLRLESRKFMCIKYIFSIFDSKSNWSTKTILWTFFFLIYFTKQRANVSLLHTFLKFFFKNIIWYFKDIFARITPISDKWNRNLITDTNNCKHA